MTRLALGLTAALTLTLAGAARADHSCPVPNQDEHYLDNVVKAMKGKSCGEAAMIAEDCALGASGDGATVGEASRICQVDFAKNKSDVALYKTFQKRCAGKYGKLSGTMYISMAAFCDLEAAKLLSSLNTAAP